MTRASGVQFPVIRAGFDEQILYCRDVAQWGALCRMPTHVGHSLRHLRTAGGVRDVPGAPPNQWADRRRGLRGF